MIRILHIVGTRLNRAGAETWLMHVLRRVSPERFQFDFVVHTDIPGHFDDEARSLGARIFVSPGGQQPLSYARKLRRTLRDSGPYDIVHSHTQHFSGYALLLARLAGVPVRIAHSHVDSAPAEQGAGPLRRAYLELAQRSIHKNATLGLASSGKAGDALFGPKWRHDPRFRTHYYGIDMSPFRDVDPATVRGEFGVPAGALMVGHVGRFDLQKNHAFLVEIAADLIRREPNTRLVLVGIGDLRPQIEERVRDLGIEDKVVFAGVRPDVPRLLQAFDVFLLPSFNEGLPVVLMETQAAGLPAVISDVIAEDNDTVPGLLSRCSLGQPASEWAERVLAVARPEASARAQALQVMASSSFNIEVGAAELFALYGEAVRSATGSRLRSLLTRTTP